MRYIREFADKYIFEQIKECVLCGRKLTISESCVCISCSQAFMPYGNEVISHGFIKGHYLYRRSFAVIKLASLAQSNSYICPYTASLFIDRLHCLQEAFGSLAVVPISADDGELARYLTSRERFQSAERNGKYGAVVFIGANIKNQRNLERRAGRYLEEKTDNVLFTALYYEEDKSGRDHWIPEAVAKGFRRVKGKRAPVGKYKLDD